VPGSGAEQGPADFGSSRAHQRDDLAATDPERDIEHVAAGTQATHLQYGFSTVMPASPGEGFGRAVVEHPVDQLPGWHITNG
jgi:hypothetical protein